MSARSATASRRRRYRRFVIAFSIIGGIAVGLGLGSLTALAGTPALILLLVLPLAARVIGVAIGRQPSVDPVVWVWPMVALPVACATFLLVPPAAAAIGLGLAVGTWFAMIVVGGVLEVAFDPDGKIAGTTE